MIPKYIDKGFVCTIKSNKFTESSYLKRLNETTENTVHCNYVICSPTAVSECTTCLQFNFAHGKVRLHGSVRIATVELTYSFNE